MIEIFTNISKEVKELAASIWNLAMKMPNAVEAANFLNDSTNYYKPRLTEEEVNFLQVYFNTKMEELSK